MFGRFLGTLLAVTLNIFLYSTLINHILRMGKETNSLLTETMNSMFFFVIITEKKGGGMKKIFFVITIICFLFTSFGIAQAGPYTTQLGKCAIEKTSKQEKLMFVRFTATMLLTHPELEDLCCADKKKVDSIIKKAAHLYMNILTNRCKKEAKKAKKHEGMQALHKAFQLLGSTSARMLMNHPKVKQNYGDLGKYMKEELQ